MKTAKRLLIISRPFYCLSLASIFIGGIFLSNTVWNLPAVLGLLYLAAPMGLVIFGINDIADRATDERNFRKGGIEGAVLKLEEIPLVIRSQVILTLSFMIAFLTMGKFLAAGIIAAITAIAYVYSIKPIRLKSVPILDSAANGLGVGLIFLLGYSAIGDQSSITLPPLGFVVAIFLTSSAIHALTTLFDLEVDSKAGDRTTGLVLGERRTIIFSLTCFFVSAAVVSFPGAAVYVYYAASILTLLVVVKSPTRASIRRGTYATITFVPLLCLYFILFDRSPLR